MGEFADAPDIRPTLCGLMLKKQAFTQTLVDQGRELRLQARTCPATVVRKLGVFLTSG